MLLTFCTIAHCAVFGKAEVWVSCFLFQKIPPQKPLANFCFIAIFVLFPHFSSILPSSKIFSNFFTSEKFHPRKR